MRLKKSAPPGTNGDYAGIPAGEMYILCKLIVGPVKN